MTDFILRADAAALARQIARKRETRAAQVLGEEIAQAILDGQVPEEEPDSLQRCSCGRVIQEGKARRPWVAIGCTCGNVWHRRADSDRLILGAPSGREEDGA